jgi:hypothetical protein
MDSCESGEIDNADESSMHASANLKAINARTTPGKKRKETTSGNRTIFIRKSVYLQ